MPDVADRYTAENGVTILPGGYLDEASRDADLEAQIEARREAREAGFDVSFDAQREFAHETPTRTLADILRDQLCPLTDQEFERAKVPHPHVFEGAGSGIFPKGEVSILGAPGREGKTTHVVGSAIAGALGLSLAGMAPARPMTSVILSAEDNRVQYARKIAAQTVSMRPADRLAVIDRVRVLDFETRELADYRQLVVVRQGQSMPAAALLEALTEVLRNIADPEAPLGQVFIETASSISEAPEDNTGLRVLAAVCKHLARELGVAVILSHHTSQASAANLRTLDIGTGDIRGGTALVFNTRQTWLLVNLGSDTDPFPESDSRSVLRQMVAYGSRERISALICLDSSKCPDPPPIFFRWEDTVFGSRQIEVTPPSNLAGLHWRKLHRMLNGARTDARLTAKAEERQSEVRRVVAVVQRLDEDGKQPTARAVSLTLGRAPGWATPHLGRAVADRLLIACEEAVPRTRGPQVVYRPSRGIDD